MKRTLQMFTLGFTVSFAAVSAAAGGLGLARAEFDKYHKRITGKEASAETLALSIDAKVSTSGNDAYTIVSTEKGVKVTGSNLRSVFYGVYDLLERRGGCRWFWDGDVVPRKNALDLTGLDVKEEARFEYRAIRYFAHRGLTRFQAEHWGPEDWKKEIDWMLKRRINVFMLRIGQDDLFQRAFPDVCAYPDPSKPLPGAGKGYDDRSLFWSLQFRGRLRRQIQKYGFDRGLLVPEDFGTMTHWYSTTPQDYLRKKKPAFLPESHNITPGHGRGHSVWDVRDDKWAEAYWKLTTTAVDAYGKDSPRPRLLHTIGLGERMCYKDRAKNFALKKDTLHKFLGFAKRDYPDAKILLAAWDFYCTWKGDEVKEFLKTIDKDRVIVWDYSADLVDYMTKKWDKPSFTKWDVMGKFPYTFSIFLAYERALDARANYPMIEARQKMIQNDPYCKGYVFWPESSHTDTLLLRYFTANGWSDRLIPHGEILDEFCASRYGANADAMKSAWKAALPVSWLRGPAVNFTTATLGFGRDAKGRIFEKPLSEVGGKAEEAKAVFSMLQKVPWRDDFIRRDTVDIARMVLDRNIAVRVWEFGMELQRWRKGADNGPELAAKAKKVADLCDGMADILELHTDYSLWESYLRLDAVEKIRNPKFTETLFENASCGYCRSHQYEFVRYWYARYARNVADRVAKAVARNDRKTKFAYSAERDRLAIKKRPLESLKPTRPRTEENFHKSLRKVETLLAR